MTLDALAGFLTEHDRYIIASHDGPDADGLGASYALALALRSIGKTVYATVPTHVPAKYRFIDQQGLFVPLASPETLNFDLSDFILVIIDTQDLNYLGVAAERVIRQAAERVIIDHHELSVAAGQAAYVDPMASSSCEIVYGLIGKIGAEPTLDVSEALFAGMVYDTGSFAYPKTGDRCFAYASELVRAGVKPYAIHGRLYESGSIGVLILQKAVLSTLELHAESRVAVQVLHRSDLAASGAAYEDAEDLVNIPLQSRTVEVSLLFKENLEGRIRCSLRSKGGVNVAHVAQTFGGGGHKTAAGFTCRTPLESSKADVLKTIVAALARSGGS
ncbi:MAG TPA: bifunctional oligoribonuclease/PAP phosphatase NrnA [Rectinemataceae bacterium]|nr:bifunctional oligoribonuclease/PAP phosphatase NrnA [Rectinemataceae bacterium]